MTFSNFKKYIFSFLLICTCGIFAFALSVPELTGPVVDKANLLSADEYHTLSTELTSISEQTGTQIAVLTIPSLQGEALEEYSMKVCENWKLGSKKNDDGVLLLVAFAEKKIRIEVGYGLEGQLTDTKCGIIIRQYIAPAFQSGNYGKGIINAVKIIESIVLNEEIAELDTRPAQATSSGTSSIIVIIFILFYMFAITGALSRKFKWLRWLPWFSLFQGSPRSHSSNHHDDFFGGFGGSGGFGGGGFSGGGGGFGGGGASGGW